MGRKFTNKELLTKEQLSIVQREQGHTAYLKEYNRKKYNENPEFREKKKLQMRKYAAMKSLEKRLTKAFQKRLQEEELKRLQEK